MQSLNSPNNPVRYVLLYPFVSQETKSEATKLPHGHSADKMWLGASNVGLCDSESVLCPTACSFEGGRPVQAAQKRLCPTQSHSSSPAELELGD